MITRTRLTVAAAALLGLTACTGKPDTVTFGVAGPLERANGKSMKQAVQLAVDEINAKGGLQIELVMGDDDANKQTAIDVARTMRLKPEVLAVIGHVTSGTTIEAAEVYNAGTDSDSRMRSGDGSDTTNATLAGTEPLVEISPASSADEITKLGPYTFRVVPTDSEHAPVLADWIGRLGRRRAAIVYSNDDYGRGVSSGFAKAFRAQGGTVVAEDPYLPAALGAGEGAQPYLSRALGRGADALVIAGPADRAMGIIRQARALGFTGTIAGGDGLTSLKDSADAAGLYVSSAFLPDARAEAARRFVEAYQKRFNELPDHRGAMAYDIVYLLYAAVQSGARDRAAIQQYLTRVTGESAFTGVTGRVEFDENGDARNRPVTIGEVRGGRLVTATPPGAAPAAAAPPAAR